MLEPASLPIAQVHTPQGSVWYVAQARSHDGFLVQRRYRGVGEPNYSTYSTATADLWASHEYVEAYLEPLLNPGAVRAAGLSAASIREWVAAHPGEVFTHPIYAPLCLRWDDNAHGYRVEECKTPALTPEAVPFTPHTCWELGITYYQWAASPQAEEELLEQVRVPARLREHIREIGQEGTWSGWYTTDHRALSEALAAQGRHLVLAQPRICYGVFTQEWLEITVLMTTDTAEEAHKYYTALPEAPGPFHRSLIEGSHVCFGHLIQWPGQAAEWVLACDKQVLVPEGKQFYLHYVASSGMVTPRMRANELFEQEFSVMVPLVTLAAVLASTNLIRWRLAEALGWTQEELGGREQDPGQLTLVEVERVSELTQRPVEQLLRYLREEMRARATMATQTGRSVQPAGLLL